MIALTKIVSTKRLAAVVVIAAGFGIYWFGGGSATWKVLRVQAAAPAPMARTAVLVETSTDAADLTVRSRTTHAVRGDGADVTVYQTLDANDAVVAQERRMVFPDRLVVSVNDDVRARSTRRSRESNFALFFVGAQRTPSTDCLRSVAGEDLGAATEQRFAGFETVGGVRAAKFSRQVTDSRTQPSYESWFAPSLGCELVRQVSGSSVKSIESVKLGDPDPALFTIPDYEELKPSDVHARVRQLRAGDANANRNHGLDESQDREYLANRP